MQGAIFSDIDIRDYRARYIAQTVDFPKSFELEMIRVKNQGRTGSCVAHALSSIIEYYNNKQNHDSTEMSIGYIYGNRTTSTYKGSGMVVRDALKAICLYGDVYKHSYVLNDNAEVPDAISQFEENKDDLYEYGYLHRISQYCRVDDENTIKASLMSGNPVVMAMKWYSDMKVVNGVLTTSYERYTGAHCMVIYGWNEQGWKVQNSWGELWGNKGTVIIPYDIELRECWTLTDDIIEGIEVKKPFSYRCIRFIAKFVNKIYNIIKKYITTLKGR